MVNNICRQELFEQILLMEEHGDLRWKNDGTVGNIGIECQSYRVGFKATLPGTDIVIKL